MRTPEGGDGLAATLLFTGQECDSGVEAILRSKFSISPRIDTRKEKNSLEN